MSDTTQHEWDDEVLYALYTGTADHFRAMQVLRDRLVFRLAETERERDTLRQQLADCRSLYAELRTEANTLLAERDRAEAQIARGYAPMAQGKEFYTELNKRVESEDADNGE